ncbi:MAG: thiopurine S-methyltransferase [Balneolaceae bacterium]|nr:thiopurine S-methyltransferase [Balneolaceae bacterium]
MEISYWTSRWRKNKLGWHMQQVYPPLIKYWDAFSLKIGDRVLVPMCGKSRDLVWLADQGVQVIGVEVSEIAARQFFQEQALEYKTQEKGPFTIYESGSIQFWLESIFKLTEVQLPAIDAIYDKAALIALPPDKRPAYARLIRDCSTEIQTMLINTFEYEQDEMNGPPFAVFEYEIRDYYADWFEIYTLHERSALEELSKFRLRGLQSYLTEKVYVLQKK